MYMMPSTTMGAVSMDSRTSVWKVNSGRNFFTLPVLICVPG